MKEERIDDVRKIVNFENYNMAEPKYRYAIGRKLGSFISISRKNYRVLMKGKSNHCSNSRFG